MNLALHGFLLQVILSILNFKHGFRLCSAGEPGYLDFDNLPETNFSCQGKVIGGYYADVEAGCQMFHVCTIGQKDEIMDIKFLCLNGTVFDQETRVCERVDEVDCSKSERFYNLNLELYGNNAVTLSLHEEDDDDSTEPRDEHQQHHMTSVGPSTTSSTTTTTSRPNQSPTTSANKVYQQHATGYPQHYQPRPAFPSVQTSQSNTHYDDKNGGYHHQYIFHNDERNNNNQATSYQLFSNQGASSTTPTPQVHQQVRYSSTSNPQVIHNEPSTATPVQYHIQSTSSTIQTLLNNNGNNPSIINPLYHNHGIASTTEQFNIHNNNPREIAEYQDNSEDEHDEHVERKPLEPVQSSNQGKVSKLTISPVPQQENRPSIQTKTSSQSSQQQRISINYLPTPSPIQTTISTFYPTQRSSSQKPQKSQSNQQVTQHIHVPPPPVIPQLKPHQITINLPPPDIQRIVQNPSPLLPSQSRVIVTAKASVSDESGRPLNASQLITLPLPTIPSNYDDYKEGDESFDPFYRDVPKIRNDRRIIVSRKVESNERSLRKKRSIDSKEYDGQPSEEVIYNAEIKDIKDLKANLPIIKAILFGLPLPQNETTGDISLKMDDTNTKINNDEFFDTDYKYTENYEDENIQENIRLFEKLAENEENINSTVVLVHEKTKNENEKKHLKNDQIDDVNLEHQQPLVFIQNEIKTNRTIMNNPVNTELKDTVQLFLNAIGNSNSTSLNENSSLESKLNLTKITENTTKKSVEPRSELIKIRFSSNSNKSNHTRYQDEESTESEEYLPRRNGRNNRPKSFRYYDDYDASESIELGTRQRSNRLRQRPQEKQGISYRNEYVDVGDEEYEDENLNINRKSSVRRGPQGRRVSSRNRNRYFDYEDDIEVHEKPRLRAKVSNTSTRTRVRPTLDRRSENRRRRPQTERRRNERRRPASYIDNVPLQNENENTTSRVTEESNLKLSQKVNPPKIEGNMENIEYNSPKKEQQGQLTTTERVRSNSLEKNKELTVKQNDHAAHDYKDSHFYEYTESVERELPDDYVDYVDLRAHLSRINNENRRNKNRYDYEFGPVLRRNSYRRDKSRKLPTVERDEIEEKTEYENIEFTTISNNQDLKTTVLPTEYTISDEISTQEYEDYSLINTTSKIDDIGSTDLEESTVITTENVRIEGILKFTDELPFTDKIEDTIEEKEATTAYIKQKDTTSLEDYVDDNYEPDSYIEPKSKQTSFQKVAKENNTRILTIDLNEETKTIDNHEVISDETATTNDKTKSVETATITGDETLDAETETINNDKADNGSHIKSENYENFDEIYNDKLENITTSFSSEDYYDSEITADPSSSPATMLPISKIVEMTTFSSTEKRSMATTTTNATTTSTVPPTSTLITVASTTSTTVSTMSPTIISSSVSPKTNISTTVKYKTTAKFLKPTAFRKNYVYNPTSTSPNPVIIRRGHPLAGPKPTKPPPSYNELAPKPIIRRLPLLSRTTTTTSEASVLEVSKHSVENTNKNAEDDISSSNLEQMFPSFANTISNSSSTVKSISDEVTTQSISEIKKLNNQIHVEEITTSLVGYNDTSQSKDFSFDNGVPKQNSNTYDSNNVPQYSEDSIAETSKSEIESTNYDNSSKLETTTNKVDSNFQKLDIKTTTEKTIRPSQRRKLELTSVKTQIQKTNPSPKRAAGFNCLEKEMYRFYGDVRDCRLFHYCSPGFTARQVLDFRFVCEEGTIFDEDSQSCRHDVPNPKCVKRTW